MPKLPLFEKARHGGMRFTNQGKDRSLWFLFAYIFFVALFFLILIIRLFQLTIVKGNYYRRLSEQNRTREIIIEPKRGTIIDRKGFTIAYNLDQNIDDMGERISSKRQYEASNATSHLVGYRQIADENDMKNNPCIRKLRLGDMVGKKGVEQLFDCELRGVTGQKFVEINAKGEVFQSIHVVKPRDGTTIQLTADLELQKKAHELLQGKQGAIIATSPKTGEVLLLASSPFFNPQDFEEKQGEKVTDYLIDEAKPLFNRALEGTYPPGSLFKLVVAAAALEESIITEKTEIEDTGTITAGPLTFGNWYFLQYGKTEGAVSVVKAIQRSNDIFFYRMGEKLGVEKIKAWADAFGYGKKTDSGLPEDEGVIPSPFWKEETLKDRWYLGDTYNLSIGQGYLLATPLQVHQATSVFANNGYWCKPQVLKLQNNQPECKKIAISQKTIDLIKQGMIQACSPGGTGWPLFEFKITTQDRQIPLQTACKTGTAESHAKSGLPHAWFTVFAPADNPEIVLTVLIEEGGQGSDIAAPLAKELLKTYFERKE